MVCLATVGVVAANGDGRLRQRRRAQDQPLDEVSWSNLRRFVCGSVDNVKCMNDERWVAGKSDTQRFHDVLISVSEGTKGEVCVGGDSERTSFYKNQDKNFTY